jgi:chitinase
MLPSLLWRLSSVKLPKTVGLLKSGPKKKRALGESLRLLLILGVILSASIRADALPSISVTDASVTEGNSGAANAAFQINLSAASNQTVTVQYATADSTALAGADYTALPLTTLAFAPGQTSKTVNVAVKGDTIDEADELFLLKLSDPVNATIADTLGSGKIVDDDTSAISAIGTSVTEGNSGTVPMNFTLKLSVPNSRAVSVKVQTVNAAINPATAGVDYVAQSGQIVTFAPGVTTQTLPVEVKGDLMDEENEKVGFLLSYPVNAVVGTITSGTILDDDAAPSLSVTDTSVTEGNSGTVNAAFKVNLSAVSGKTVSVKNATADGNALAGADYTALSLTTLTFTPGQISKTVNVVVQGDTVDETNEIFALKLSSPLNATIADSSGTGTITDDDTSAISCVGSTVTEGNSGTVPMNFTLKLSVPNSRAVQVKVEAAKTAISPAAAGTDYDALSTVLTFPAGTISQTVVVNVKGDVLDEDTERIGLHLSSPVNAVISADGQGFITDDDPPPSLNVGDASIIEGNSGVKTVQVRINLSAPSGKTVTVKYTTGDDTATSGDYLAVPLTMVTFAPGQTSRVIYLNTYGDTTIEPDEQFKVLLSANQAANIADNTGIVTILNDDNSPPTAVEDDYTDSNFHLPGDTIQATIDVLANDSDVDGDSLTLVSLRGPFWDVNTGDTVEIVDNKVRITLYNVLPGYGQTAQFAYVVSDGKATSEEYGYFHFDVYDPLHGDKAPIAADDVYNDDTAWTAGDTLDLNIDVLANDSDPDGDPLYLDDAYGLSGDYDDTTGSVFVDGDMVHLTIPNLQAGTSHVSFTYDIDDGTWGTDTGTVDVYFTVGSSGALKAPPRVSIQHPKSGNLF